MPNFPLELVLTLTTDKLLAAFEGAGIEGMIAWIKNDAPATFQAMEYDCIPFLIEKFPKLPDADKHLDLLNYWLQRSKTKEDCRDVIKSWVQHVSMECSKGEIDAHNHG